MARHRPRTVYAERFILKDKTNIPRLVFELKADNEMPSICFYDANNSQRMEIGINENGLPSITMLRGDGSLAIFLGEMTDDRYGVTFSRPDGSIAFQVIMNPNSETEVKINNHQA